MLRPSFPSGVSSTSLSMARSFAVIAALLPAASAQFAPKQSRLRNPGPSYPDRQFAVGQEPRAVTCADLDGDGALDLVAVSSQADTISVLRNRGARGFTPEVEYAVGN